MKSVVKSTHQRKPTEVAQRTNAPTRTLSKDVGATDKRESRSGSARSNSSSLTLTPSRQKGAVKLSEASMARIGRYNSTASLPELMTATLSPEKLPRERNCVVLDIRRKPTGEMEENTEGYRVVHLVTDFADMSLWDAVREAHRSYPENRLFKANSTLEKALQDGSKRGMLVVSGPSEDGGEPIEIKQSFDYWKKKDFITTVEALVPSHKQYMSIQVEYANVLQAVKGERDMFDQF